MSLSGAQVPQSVVARSRLSQDGQCRLAASCPSSWPQASIGQGRPTTERIILRIAYCYVRQECRTYGSHTTASDRSVGPIRPTGVSDLRIAYTSYRGRFRAIRTRDDGPIRGLVDANDDAGEPSRFLWHDPIGGRGGRRGVAAGKLSLRRWCNSMMSPIFGFTTEFRDSRASTRHPR